MYDSRISKELHRKVFELTLALYRVTDFFPQGEALRKHMREKANEIFGGLSEYGYALDLEREAIGILAKIEAMRGYLDLARDSRFVRSVNITVLVREYDVLADFFMQELGDLKQKRESQKRGDPPLRKEVARTVAQNKKSEKQRITQHIPDGVNDRQRKIILHLNERDHGKISDFHSLFREISSKTIQRDLQDLVLKNILKKEGDKRWTMYSIRGNDL